MIAGDVGGAFGAKGPIYPDQVAVIAAARALGRPVKWIEERSESFTATTHGRDQVADLELAVDADGRITAMRGTVHASFGAYFTPNAPGSLLGRLGPMLPQGYRIEHFDVELVGVLREHHPDRPVPRRRAARRPPTSASASWTWWPGRPGIDPAELRRRNFIPPGALPVHHVHRPDLRQRRLPGGPGPAAGEARWRPGDGRTATASSSAWASPTFVEPGGIMPRGTRPRRHDRRPGHGHRRRRRQGHGRGRHQRPRPGPRDRVRPARGRPARRAATTT